MFGSTTDGWHRDLVLSPIGGPAWFSSRGDRILGTPTHPLSHVVWGRDGEEIARFPASMISAARLTPDGEFVLHEQDDQACLVDLTGKVHCTYDGHSGTIESVELSRDGAMVLTACSDGRVVMLLSR